MARVDSDEATLTTGHIPIIISTLVVVLTVVGGFWSLADPRGELRSIRENYLTIREHNEFTSRVIRDTLRIESRDDDLSRTKADKDDLNILRAAIQAQLDQLRKEQLTKAEFDQFKNERDARSKHFDDMLQAIDQKIERHTERDTDRFINTLKPANSR